MDFPSLWSKVNDDVADNICNRLPIYDIGRLRCVCKRFKAVTSSDKFLKLYSLNPCSHPSLVLLVPFDSLGLELAYHPTLDAWRKLHLAFLRLSLQDCSYPVASNGGLLCFGSGRDFVVCNPITQSCKMLPKVPREVQIENGHSIELSFGEDFEQALGLDRNRTTGVYELLIINTSSGPGTINTISYNSFTGLWKGQPEPVKSAQHTLYSANIVACNHIFYSLWKHGTSIVVYCFCQGLWSAIEGPICDSPFSSCHLIDRYGCLYMIGGVGSLWLRNDTWKRPTSVRIWKLDQEIEEWAEVTRVPHSILDECHQRINFDQLRCCGKDEIMYLRSPGSDILMHDFGTRQWKWLGKEIDLDLEIGAALLEPSLSAAV